MGVTVSDFETAIAWVLPHEGGLTDNAADPGGITNFGISLHFAVQQYSIDHNMLFDVDGNGCIDGNDIRNLTKEEAEQIYRTYWWDKYGYGRVDNQDIASKILDMAINMGSSQAHKIVQRACDAEGGPCDVDGVFGPGTVGCVNRLANGDLLNAIRDAQKQFYLDLIQEHPKLAEFEHGWLNRAAA